MTRIGRVWGGGLGPFFQTFCESPCFPIEAQPRDNVPLTVPARCFLQVG